MTGLTGYGKRNSERKNKMIQEYVERSREKQRKLFGMREIKQDCRYFGMLNRKCSCEILTKVGEKLPCQVGVCYFYERK